MSSCGRMKFKVSQRERVQRKSEAGAGKSTYEGQQFKAEKRKMSRANDNSVRSEGIDRGGRGRGEAELTEGRHSGGAVSKCKLSRQWRGRKAHKREGQRKTKKNEGEREQLRLKNGGNELRNTGNGA